MPMGGDISVWTKDMTQGMNNFKPMYNAEKGSDDHMRFVNGWKGLENI